MAPARRIQGTAHRIRIMLNLLSHSELFRGIPHTICLLCLPDTAYLRSPFSLRRVRYYSNQQTRHLLNLAINPTHCAKVECAELGSKMLHTWGGLFFGRVLFAIFLTRHAHRLRQGHNLLGYSWNCIISARFISILGHHACVPLIHESSDTQQIQERGSHKTSASHISAPGI